MEGHAHSISSSSVFSHKEHTLCNRKERCLCPKRMNSNFPGQWILSLLDLTQMCLAVMHSCAWRGRAQHAAGPWELVFPVPHERRTLWPLSELGQVSLSGMLERGFMGLGDPDICALVYPQSCANLFWWGTDREPCRHHKCCLCAEGQLPSPYQCPEARETNPAVCCLGDHSHL